MKQLLSHERHSHFTLEIEREECRFGSADEIINYLKHCIDAHSIAAFIATFDHFKHTHEVIGGQVDSEILDAKNIIFCFGITLQDPHSMALRPRSIGVVELADWFIVTFMETPMPVANVTMERWAKSLIAAA
ncbi:MAG: hypothetical protein RNU03_05010 [Candidatus Sedimenticola sp. (ex Thyasira tokunagai)]